MYRQWRVVTENTLKTPWGDCLSTVVGICWTRDGRQCDVSWQRCGRWGYWLQLLTRLRRALTASQSKTDPNGYWWSRQVSGAVGRSPQATRIADHCPIARAHWRRCVASSTSKRLSITEYIVYVFALSCLMNDIGVLKMREWKMRSTELWREC